jgi:hypothetical protein
MKRGEGDAAEPGISEERFLTVSLRRRQIVVAKTVGYRRTGLHPFESVSFDRLPVAVAEAPRERLGIPRLRWVQNLSKCSESHVTYPSVDRSRSHVTRPLVELVKWSRNLCKIGKNFTNKLYTEECLKNTGFQQFLLFLDLPASFSRQTALFSPNYIRARKKLKLNIRKVM